METVPGQDASQVGMPGKTNPEHVEGLALRPVGREEDLRDRRHFFLVRDPALDPDPVVLGERVEMIDDFEPRLPIPPVDRRDVHAVAKVFRVLQVARDVGDLLAAHDDGDLLREFLGGDDGVGDSGADRLDPGVRRGVRGLDLLRRRRLGRRRGGGLRCRCCGGGLRGWRGVRRRRGLVGHRES